MRSPSKENWMHTIFVNHWIANWSSESTIKLDQFRLHNSFNIFLNLWPCPRSLSSSAQWLNGPSITGNVALTRSLSHWICVYKYNKGVERKIGVADNLINGRSLMHRFLSLRTTETRNFIFAHLISLVELKYINTWLHLHAALSDRWMRWLGESRSFITLPCPWCPFHTPRQPPPPSRNSNSTWEDSGAFDMSWMWILSCRFTAMLLLQSGEFRRHHRSVGVEDVKNKIKPESRHVLAFSAKASNTPRLRVSWSTVSAGYGYC